MKHGTVHKHSTAVKRQALGMTTAGSARGDPLRLLLYGMLYPRLRGLPILSLPMLS